MDPKNLIESLCFTVVAIVLILSIKSCNQADNAYRVQIRSLEKGCHDVQK